MTIKKAAKPAGKYNPIYPLGSLTDHPLIGRAFHVFDGNKIERQGVVLGRVDDRNFIVTWFSWFHGGATTMEIVSIDEMARGRAMFDKSGRTWQFYADTDEMGSCYEHNYHEPEESEAA
jgi:hypothetical protein